MTTDTQQRDPQYEAMVQEFVGDAHRVDGDPGAVPPVYTSETPMTGALADTEAVTRVVDTAGSAWVWHMKTYKAVPVNLNMLPDQLRKKDDQGRALFTVYGPEDDRSPIKGLYPHVGIHKCLLHPDSERRTYYNTLGLPVCVKATIPSPFQVDQHMEIKHKSEWKSIEKMRLDAEKADDRAYQRELLGAATGNAPPAAEAPNQIPPQDSEQIIPTPVAKAKKQQQVTCTQCSEVFEAATVMVAQNKLKKHMKEEHPDG